MRQVLMCGDHAGMFERRASTNTRSSIIIHYYITIPRVCLVCLRLSYLHMFEHYNNKLPTNGDQGCQVSSIWREYHVTRDQGCQVLPIWRESHTNRDQGCQVSSIWHASHTIRDQGCQISTIWPESHTIRDQGCQVSSIWRESHTIRDQGCQVSFIWHESYTNVTMIRVVKSCLFSGVSLIPPGIRALKSHLWCVSHPTKD